MNEYENKIELMNYLNVLWKRKWFIIIATFLFITAVVVISFLLPPKWEVDAIIYPSRYLIRIGGDRFEEILFVNHWQIAAQINQAVYNNLISSELTLDIKDVTKLKAEIIKSTHMVRVSIKEKDVEKAKLILHSLLTHLKRELNKEADIEKKRIDPHIKSKEKEKYILESEIKSSKNNLNIIKKRKQEIEKEISDIKKKIEELEKERRMILKKKNRSESESFTILHYSNEIHQSSIHYNILNDLLGNKEIEEEIINLKIEDQERLIHEIENEIKDLNERKGRIYYVLVIKEPTSSITSVSPKKLFNVSIAFPLGFIIFTMLAFFFEYIKKQKSKSKG